MKTKIQKWGNSLAVRIPKGVTDQIPLKEDSEVEVQEKEGQIVITPLTHSYSLSELVNKITEENCHHEEPTTPRGKEIW